jgi:hypothetical protein
LRFRRMSRQQRHAGGDAESQLLQTALWNAHHRAVIGSPPTPVDRSSKGNSPGAALRQSWKVRLIVAVASRKHARRGGGFSGGMALDDG